LRRTGGRTANELVRDEEEYKHAHMNKKMTVAAIPGFASGTSILEIAIPDFYRP
jgi:hypothetical protein